MHWEIKVLAQSEDELRFNVMLCGYAEMYESLDLRELGAVLSCQRDAALIEGVQLRHQIGPPADNSWRCISL